MSSFQINITQSDIDAALRNNSARCVVATAIKRTLPEATRVEVDIQTLRWTNAEGERVVFVTPYTVMNYIAAFDAGDEILPFRFRLRYDQRATIPKVVRNTERKRIANARVQLHRQNVKAQAIVDDPTSTKAQRTVAREQVARAKEVLAEIEKVDGPKAAQTSTKADRTRMPKVFKTSRREYGARVLRVNQPPK